MHAETWQATRSTAWKCNKMCSQYYTYKVGFVANSHERSSFCWICSISFGTPKIWARVAWLFPTAVRKLDIVHSPVTLMGEVNKPRLEPSFSSFAPRMVGWDASADDKKSDAKMRVNLIIVFFMRLYTGAVENQEGSSYERNISWWLLNRVCVSKLIARLWS